jgi:hypothetical protein
VEDDEFVGGQAAQQFGIIGRDKSIRNEGGIGDGFRRRRRDRRR